MQRLNELFLELSEVTTVKSRKELELEHEISRLKKECKASSYGRNYI